jgi:general L-amino acid transport system permease protein
MAVQDATRAQEPAKASLIYDPKVRSIFFQVLLILLLVLGIWWIVDNTVENLRRSNISTGFDFLRRRAGFDISTSLVPYSSDSTYGDAIIIGFLNTIVVAVTGIITATILGFVIGVARLSRNWLLRKIAMIYVEIFRNIPPLLVIFFWYLGVLSILPAPRDSIGLPFGSYLNSRGFYFPRFIWEQGSWLVVAGLVVGVALTWFVAHRARIRQMATGQRFPVFWTGFGLIVGFPLLGFALAGFPLTLDFPQAGTFNLTGGFNVKPEFLSLYLALSFYTAAFIAEIVRAGVLAISRGQWDAAHAVGLSRPQAVRHVVMPQAVRVIVPPLASQYLDLTKNSSLAVAIGYPDLVSIANTAINQTGQAIEGVAIIMAVYLTISLSISTLMNWYNARVMRR